MTLQTNILEDTNFITSAEVEAFTEPYVHNLQFKQCQEVLPFLASPTAPPKFPEQSQNTPMWVTDHLKKTENRIT